jgi:archaemetzincin
MSSDNIQFISFGYFETSILESIIQDVEREYSLPVLLKEGHLDLSDFYDSSRRQYNGNSLLKELDQHYASDQCKTLGLFSIDLFIPILTYIFGQAYLNGRCGIASLYRLSNERYGIQRQDQLLSDRFGKEIIHELGHMFGLIHCHNPECVMRSSTYAEDIDQKKQTLCAKCKAQLVL